MEIDKEVILLMSQGDEWAYRTMFRKFYPKVHRFVFMLLKNMDDTDDVHLQLFPIPQTEFSNNPQLKQNAGYAN